MSTTVSTPRQRVAAALAAQQAQLQASVTPFFEESICTAEVPVRTLAVPIPLAERPAGEAAQFPTGRPCVKPFERLPALTQELVASGGATLSTTPFTVPPLDRVELQRERSCLEREAATITRRLRQISQELLGLPSIAA
jgi:hypothetical protein